jgi:hypothetical protein
MTRMLLHPWSELDELIDAIKRGSLVEDSGWPTVSTAEDAADASADSGSGSPLWREPGPLGDLAHD